MKNISLVIFCVFLAVSAQAQDVNATSISAILSDTVQKLLPFDTTRVRVEQAEKNKQAKKATDQIPLQQGTPFKNVLRYDFYATAAALSFINKPESEEKGNIQLYYNATINNRLKIKKFTWTFFLFNEYGYKQYFDSLGIKSDDVYNLRNAIQWDLYKNKLKFNANINTKSQLWKAYQYETTDSNTVIKTFYSSYFSPGYILYSGGLSFTTNNDIVFELGLASGKTTKIRNQEIFDSRDVKKLYGLAKGEKSKSDFGYNLIITAPVIELRKDTYWETNAVFFTQNRTSGFLKQYTVDVNNAFHFLFFKYLRLSLRTKIIYDLNIQKEIFISNQISFGFYLSNKMK